MNLLSIEQFLSSALSLRRSHSIIFSLLQTFTGSITFHLLAAFTISLQDQPGSASAEDHCFPVHFFTTKQPWGQLAALPIIILAL